MVSLAQLRELGLSSSVVHNRTKAGRLHRIHRGVYAVGHRNLPTKARWLAAVLACGPEAVLSHRAALALWELRPAPSRPYDVTVVARGRSGPAGVRVHCVRALEAFDRAVFDGIPVTSVARAMLDYSAIATPNELRTALEAAERLERLDGRAIAELIERSPGRATTRLRDALAAMTGAVPWTRSELEREILALVREAGLPEPQCNVTVLGTEVDFFWPGQGLVVEADSWGFHRTRARFEEDRRRDMQRQLHGLRAIRITQRRIEGERARVQAELQKLLRQVPPAAA